MSDRACVYILNDNQIYHGMFSVSIRTLRRSNPSIPVVLVYVRDGNADSWHQTMESMRSAFDRRMVSDYMVGGEESVMRLCSAYSVRVVLVDGLPYQSQNFASVQRCLLRRVELREALLLDVDTFVFGRLDGLFESRPGCDLVASPMVGISGSGVDSHDVMFSYLLGGRLVKRMVRPANSGVVVFRDGSLGEYGSVVKPYCDLLMGKKHPMSHMMYSMRPDGRSREEFAFNVYALERGKRMGLFDKSEVCTYDYQPGSLLFHSSSAAYPSHFANFCREGALVHN